MKQQMKTVVTHVDYKRTITPVFYNAYKRWCEYHHSFHDTVSGYSLLNDKMARSIAKINQITSNPNIMFFSKTPNDDKMIWQPNMMDHLAEYINPWVVRFAESINSMVTGSYLGVDKTKQNQWVKHVIGGWDKKISESSEYIPELDKEGEFKYSSFYNNKVSLNNKLEDGIPTLLMVEKTSQLLTSVNNGSQYPCKVIILDAVQKAIQLGVSSSGKKEYSLFSVIIMGTEQRIWFNLKLLCQKPEIGYGPYKTGSAEDGSIFEGWEIKVVLSVYTEVNNRFGNSLPNVANQMVRKVVDAMDGKKWDSKREWVLENELFYPEIIMAPELKQEMMPEQFRINSVYHFGSKPENLEVQEKESLDNQKEGAEFIVTDRMRIRSEDSGFKPSVKYMFRGKLMFMSQAEAVGELVRSHYRLMNKYRRGNHVDTICHSLVFENLYRLLVECQTKLHIKSNVRLHNEAKIDQFNVRPHSTKVGLFVNKERAYYCSVSELRRKWMMIRTAFYYLADAGLISQQWETNFNHHFNTKLMEVEHKIATEPTYQNMTQKAGLHYVYPNGIYNHMEGEHDDLAYEVLSRMKQSFSSAGVGLAQKIFLSKYNMKKNKELLLPTLID